MSANTATRGSRAVPARELLQVFTVSLSLLLFELCLVRLFSILIRNLSFLALATALFGGGLGGLYAQIWRERSTNVHKNLFYLPVFMALAMALAIIILCFIPLNQAGGGTAQHYFFRLGLAFLGSSLPFFFGSMFIALTFARRPDAAATLYFSDLVGASLGCLLAVFVLALFGGLTTPFLAALLGVGAALTIGGQSLRRRWLAFAAIPLLLVMALLTHFYPFMNLVPSSGGKQMPVLFSKWNSYSWVTVDDDTSWKGWRLSRRYNGPDPKFYRIRQDGHAPAFITPFDGDFKKVEFLKYDMTSLPYRIIDPEKVLVIGAGGGRDILTAKMYGVPFVHGVEINAVIVNNVMRGAFAEASGNIYTMEGVEVFAENGRTFVAASTDKYDLIYTSLADTLLGNSEGLHVLAENHIYTVEAFKSYLDKLAPGGMACILYHVNASHLLDRLTASAVEALRMRGVEDASDHFLAIVTEESGSGMAEGVCLLFSNDPLSDETVQRAARAAEDLGYLLAWPGDDPQNSWNRQLTQLLDPALHKQYVAGSYYDRSPMYDNRPYLFYDIRPAQFLGMLLAPWSTSQRLSRGVEAMPILIDVFLVVFLCVLALMIAPLVLFRRSELAKNRPEKSLFLTLFFILGVAFMMIEISLLQQLFLYLGNPILTFSVVLFIMLAVTGAGSLLSRFFQSERLWASMSAVALVAAAIQLAVLLILPLLMKQTQGSSLPVRLLIALPPIGILALPMGMLFPSAIRLFSVKNLDITCWAWGMNGVGSVLGTVAASMIAINLGIAAVFVTGIGAYTVIAALAYTGKRLFPEQAAVQTTQPKASAA